eukprot:CAMPEP_0173202762 /NCGR_PEP_ID=MMETSP1141-20130122/19147_1 /TAXON_ID=483371 /ORGANISM="non described non described, Strain CCMP2298" /LENGTH=238 /DNA_ID=CAMNT_0014128151 /DNA_START=15 /DNA_END=731 /DNA_ORIENTATION=-
MSISLKYWGGRGLMEVPRQMLAIAGKFPSEGGYEDGRFTEPPAGLEWNLGRMPVASVGDQSVGQSVAINFAIATECGMMGSSTMETAQILAIQEHLKEAGAGYKALVPYGTEPSAEALDTWFDSGSEDNTGAADRAGYSTRFLTWYAGRIEGCMGADGFAVGGKLSLADVLIYNMFAEVLKDDECAVDTPAFKREAFGCKARTDVALAKFPKLKASVEAVAANANLQKWLSTRGMQGF